MSSVTHKKTQKSNNYNQEISKNHENNLTGKQVVLLIPLTKFFAQKENITKLKAIIDGTSKLSLRLIDWFVTNYSKKNYIMYNLKKLQELSNPQKPQSSKSRKKQSLNLDESQSPPTSNIEDTDNLLFFPSSPKSQQMEAEIEPDIESTEELFSDYFNVFNDYRAQLKSLNKRNFDPFCRRSRIKFYYGKTNDDYIITTVGQLNFFKWSIENYILEYIELNLEKIDEDMNNNIDIKKYNDKTKKKKNSDKQKKTLSNNKPQNATNTDKESGKEIQAQKSTRRKRKELSISASKSFMIHNVKAVIEFR